MNLAKTSLVALVSLVPAVVLAASDPGSEPGARVVRESSDGLTLRITVPAPARDEVLLPDGRAYLRVTIPGFVTRGTEDAGVPDLPVRGFSFGVPRGTRATLAAVRVLSSTSFQGLPPVPIPERRMVPGDLMPAQEETYTPDPRTYASGARFPATLAELTPAMGFRHQRVQTVLLSPVQASPASGSYEAATEVEVDIRFTPEAGAVEGRRVPVMEDAPGWKTILDRTLVNSKSARSFRSRPAPEIRPLTLPVGQANVRIRLGGSGFCRIPFADLAAAGLASGQLLDEILVEEHGFDSDLTDPYVVTPVPRFIEDTNQNGTFEAGDFLVFYGFNYRDRFNAPIPFSRFSYFHTYWVRTGTGGRDFTTVDGYPAGTYTPVTSFPYAQREEENILYLNNPVDSGGSIYPNYDTLYWLTSRQTNEFLAFTIRDLDPAGSFDVSAQWKGTDVVPQTATHIVSLNVNDKSILDSYSFFNQHPYTFRTGTPLPSADYLQEGLNIMNVRGRTTNPDINQVGALFDWYEVSYDRMFQAVGDQLKFTTGRNGGLQEIAVEGFSGPEIRVMDITDPGNVFELTPLVEDAGGVYTARIRVDATQGKRRLHAALVSSLPRLPDGPALPPDLGTEAIASGLPRDLIQEGNGSDYILITHPEFEDAWAPLIAHRESKGHRVFLCDVWEIYDQFGGGDKSPWAIQAFLAEAYRTWTPNAPSFLLLGGDASEDYRSDTPNSDPDWVPTMMHFGNVPGTAGLELCGTDTWYAAFLEPDDPPTDVLPEMHVARLPVGSVQEATDAVQKILDYESMDPGDNWRKRGLFFADDQYSTSILANAPYCYQANELVFENTCQEVCDSIRVAGKISDFDCQLWFLSDRLDTVSVLRRNPGPGDCPTDPGTGASMQFATRTYTRANITETMVNELTRGHLIFEFTGHGNRTQMTHETVLIHNPTFSLSSRDMDRVNNLGRPFIFMGYACHLVEFEGAREKELGESFGENMLLPANRGAIAVVASTGYEWLHTNRLIQIRTTAPLFWAVPRDPETGRPRRLMGEAMTSGMTTLLLSNPTNRDYVGMMRTYQTFSDPALRVDIHTSAFSVEIDGEPWEEGTVITAPSAQDSLLVEVVVSDDVDVSAIRVLDAGVELPAGRVTVTPPDPADRGAQFYQVSFKVALRLGTYNVTIEATDWTGRVSQAVIPIVLDTAFFADRSRLDPNEINTVDPRASLRVAIKSPLPLTAELIDVWVDGALAEDATLAQGETAFDWEATVTRSWGEGNHVLEVRFDGGASGQVVRNVSFSTTEKDLAASGFYFYPNPVETGEGMFLYNLNRNARDAVITIYSVSGRRVLRTKVDGWAGKNAFRWDLRDQAGDEVANGIYLLVLSLDGYDGEDVSTRSRPEKIVVAR